MFSSASDFFRDDYLVADNGHLNQQVDAPDAGGEREV